MLSAISGKLRIRSAFALAVIYAACILAPSLAFALPNSTAAHCLVEDTGGAKTHQHEAAMHVHANGGAHRHAAATPKSHDEDKDHATGCCNLFSLTAIPANAILTLGAVNRVAGSFVVLKESLSGRVPERITRPPIA